MCMVRRFLRFAGNERPDRLGDDVVRPFPEPTQTEQDARSGGSAVLDVRRGTLRRRSQEISWADCGQSRYSGRERERIGDTTRSIGEESRTARRRYFSRCGRRAPTWIQVTYVSSSIGCSWANLLCELDQKTTASAARLSATVLS
jgi:hypothetical protein